MKNPFETFNQVQDLFFKNHFSSVKCFKYLHESIDFTLFKHGLKPELIELLNKEAVYDAKYNLWSMKLNGYYVTITIF